MLVGGHVETGETPEQAAARELYEDTGLTLELVLWKRYVYLYAPGVVVDQFIFSGKVDSENPPMRLGEGQAIRFFEEEIRGLEIGFGFGLLLEEYFNPGG